MSLFITDNAASEIFRKELERQQEGLELIASENFVSEAVMMAQGSVLTNKYAEGYPGKRYYGGCEVVDLAENLAISRLKELFGAEWVNVQPHSGSQANMAVFLSVLKPGDTFLGLSLAHGGHLTHGSPVNFSGILYNAVGYELDRDSGLLNYETIEEKAHTHKPKLLIAGGSAYSRDWDYQRLRNIADSVGALFLCDMAHPAGLIAKGHLNNPLKYCHFVTSTTHKTLRGPRGGIILMGKDFENPFGIKTLKGDRLKLMSEILDSTVMPGIQGGPLMHVILSKAVAFGEALSDKFGAYTTQVIANSRALSQALINMDYKIISGGTDNHLMLIDLTNKNISGKQAEIALGKAGITVNKNMVPFDTKSPFVTSGIRIGTPATTSRGMKEDAMHAIAGFINEAICTPADETRLAAIKKSVATFCASYSLYPDIG